MCVYICICAIFVEYSLKSTFTCELAFEILYIKMKAPALLNLDHMLIILFSCPTTHKEHVEAQVSEQHNFLGSCCSFSLVGMQKHFTRMLVCEYNVCREIWAL